MGIYTSGWLIRKVCNQVVPPRGTPIPRKVGKVIRIATPVEGLNWVTGSGYTKEGLSFSPGVNSLSLGREMPRVPAFCLPACGSVSACVLKMAALEISKLRNTHVDFLYSQVRVNE